MPDKQATIAEYRLHDSDTGSPEVQIALLVGSDQPPDRAPEGAQRGPPHPAGPDEAHRPAPPAARLRPQERRRALPHHHQPPRHSTVAEHHYNGRLEPLAASRRSLRQRGGRPLGTRRGVPPTTRGASCLTPFPCRRPISGTDRTMSFEAGKLAQLADGAVAGPHRRHRPAGHGHRGPVGTGGDRLLPPHRRHRGADLRRRQDPRLVLPPGGQDLGPGHPDLPADRPAAAPVVPRGLPQRGPRRRHHLRRRPGQPARRAGHQRRLRRADDLGHPLRRPHRGRAGRLHDRRRSGSRTRPSRRARSPPSSWSWPAGPSARTPTPRSPS